MSAAFPAVPRPGRRPGSAEFGLRAGGLPGLGRYPRVVVHLDRIAQNARAVIDLCRRHFVDVTGITKGVCGDPRIAATLASCGISSLGDSRLANLERIRSLGVERWLIRIPMLSECEDVVRLADVSLVSEVLTLRRLAEHARRRRRHHGVVLMVEMGDRREGCCGEEELSALVREVDASPSLVLRGIGTNLGCLGFVRTTDEKMQAFSRLVRRVAGERPILVSAGNSSALAWLAETRDPGRVNHLRLGEALVLGRERRDYAQLPGTRPDSVILEAEIVELKRKPSLPDGEIGRDSFGCVPRFENSGSHWRAVCAVGRQDIEPEALAPEDGGTRVLGVSSDHMLLEVPEGRYRLGDVVSFRLGYMAVLKAMTGSYCAREYRGAPSTAGEAVRS